MLKCPNLLGRSSVGEIIFMATSPQTEEGSNARVFLTWTNLTIQIERRNQPPRYILQNVTGYAEPGSLDCIMGPSGCGKTTLLNALAGRLGSSPTQSGEILVNGRRQTLSYGNSAYVTQDDYLIATLTVLETLVYSAHLQLPDTMTRHERKGRVQRVIKEMGLQDCVNTKIGGWHVRGLSGGEKRRVSIAIELLNHPQLLFLDEPTSGLDSSAAYHVVKRLRILAKAGKTVLVSIHQPNSEVFGLFTHLTLLSAGRTVYFGETDKAQQFFDNTGFPCPEFRNPSDHYLWVINSDFDETVHDDIEFGDSSRNMTVSQKVQLLVSSYSDSEVWKAVNIKIQQVSSKRGELLTSADRVNFFKQTYYLTSRSFTNMRRDKTYYWFRLFVYTMLSICVGTIFYKVGLFYNSIQARAGLLTFVTAFLTFLGIVSFPAMIEDMKIFSRERMNGHYGVAAFVISNWTSSFPFTFLLALSPSIILYNLGGLHHGFDHWVFFFMTLVAALSIVESLLLAISSIAPDFLVGLIAGSGIMGMYLLNGGFFRLFSDLPKPVWRYPLSYMSFHSWTNRALYNNDFQGLVFENNVAGGPPLRGEDLLRERYDMNIPYSKWWALVVLAGMVFVYRAIFILSLKMREIVPAIISRVKSKRMEMLERAPSGRFVAPEKLPEEELPS